MGHCRLLTLSLPLLFFPRLLSLVLSSFLLDNTAGSNAGGSAEDAIHSAGAASAAAAAAVQTIRSLNPLETTLSQLAGVLLFSYAALSLVQSGAIPLISSAPTARSSALRVANIDRVVEAPHRLPTTFISTLLLAGIYKITSDVDLMAISIMSGILALAGAFTVSTLSFCTV